MTLMVRQRGVGLIEILVSVLLFSIGLLAMANLQMVSLKMNDNADLRTRANLLATDLVERMRVNPGNWDAYDVAFADCQSGIDGSGQGVEEADQVSAQQDLVFWCGQVGRELPGGKGQVNFGNGRVSIVLRWEEREGREQLDDDGESTGSEWAEKEFKVTARLR